jgi:hypothetical protein
MVMAKPLPFARGDRVTVKTSALCPHPWHRDFRGAQGVVVGVYEPGEIPDGADHVFAVKSADEDSYWQTSFSADELEKV